MRRLLPMKFDVPNKEKDVFGNFLILGLIPGLIVDMNVLLLYVAL